MSVVKTLANKVLCRLPDCGTVFSFFPLIIPHEIKKHIEKDSSFQALLRDQ